MTGDVTNLQRAVLVVIGLIAGVLLGVWWAAR